MTKIVHSIFDLIGETPLFDVTPYLNQDGPCIYLKLENMNAGGSAKSRIAYNIIEQAEKRGDLKKGQTVIEGTAGNTGIGLAMVATVKDYPCKIVVSPATNPETLDLIHLYGGETLTVPDEDAFKGMGCEDYAQYLAKKNGYFCAYQSENPDNIDIHYRTTGPEIVAALKKVPDVYIAGVGTGGTLTGTGRYLREQSPTIDIYAVEPAEADFLTGGEFGPHRIPGIGVSSLPKNLDLDLCKSVLDIKSQDAQEMMQKIAKSTGLVLGASTGANLVAAIHLSEYYSKDTTMVCIAGDNGERYIQNGYFK